jgi:hypothetical protein
MAKKPERWVTLGSTDWLAAQEWLPPLLAERAEERVAAAAYTAYRNTRPERKRPWEDGYTDKPRSAQEQALAKKAFRIRMSTDETRLKGAIAEIVEKYPTGDDTTSDRYQAHRFIREREIVALFQKRLGCGSACVWTEDTERAPRWRHRRGRQGEAGHQRGVAEERYSNLFRATR